MKLRHCVHNHVTKCMYLQTHLGVHVTAGSAGENTNDKHDFNLLKIYTEPEKQVHNSSFRLKHPACVYIYACECVSVLTQCMNVFVIQPSQRKLSSILSLSLLLSLCLSPSNQTLKA